MAVYEDDYLEGLKKTRKIGDVPTEIRNRERPGYRPVATCAPSYGTLT
jgi:hypothetical protein